MITFPQAQMKGREGEMEKCLLGEKETDNGEGGLSSLGNERFFLPDEVAHHEKEKRGGRKKEINCQDFS